MAMPDEVRCVAGIALQAASATLRMLLNRQDAVLGPWMAGRGPLDDALQAFAGAPGGPSHHPWEAGLPISAGYAGTAIGGTGSLIQCTDKPPSQQHVICEAASTAYCGFRNSAMRRGFHI